MTRWRDKLEIAGDIFGGVLAVVPVERDGRIVFVPNPHACVGAK